MLGTSKLGINPGTLGNWVNADRERRGGDGALSEDERAELVRLFDDKNVRAVPAEDINGRTAG